MLKLIKSNNLSTLLYYKWEKEKALMKKSISDIITEYTVNEGMSDILLQDEEYKVIQQKIDKQTD